MWDGYITGKNPSERIVQARVPPNSLQPDPDFETDIEFESAPTVQASHSTPSTFARASLTNASNGAGAAVSHP
jgi:hypothetical protein